MRFPLFSSVLLLTVLAVYYGYPRLPISSGKPGNGVPEISQEKDTDVNLLSAVPVPIPKAV
jgi:hypothetical protein